MLALCLRCASVHYHKRGGASFGGPTWRPTWRPAAVACARCCWAAIDHFARAAQLIGVDQRRALFNRRQLSAQHNCPLARSLTSVRRVRRMSHWQPETTGRRPPTWRPAETVGRLVLLIESGARTMRPQTSPHLAGQLAGRPPISRVGGRDWHRPLFCGPTAGLWHPERRSKEPRKAPQRGERGAV